MVASKTDIIARLQKEILSLGGYKSSLGIVQESSGLSLLKHFPNAVFPTAAIHEFVSSSPEEMAACSGFISGLMSSFLARGIIVWISRGQTIFPQALQAFNIEPHKIIFIHPTKEKEIWWCIEEALRCSSITAVVTEMQDLNFTNSRRFQLAVEKTKVTGFILNAKPGNPNASACISRWKITSLPSHLEDGLPGVGHPRWKVELKKIRNGKPGTWEIEWTGEEFIEVREQELVIQIGKRKTG